MQIPKFRIWDKSNKCWATDFTLSLDGELLCDNGSTLFIKDNFILMQWTGLQDSNGALDVYEGDILCHDFGGGVDTCVIERNSDDCQLHVRYLYVPGYNTDYLAEASLDSWIIIGNIYEHPHLLEETKNENKI